MTSRLRLQTIVSAPFDENSYIVSLPDRNEAIVIDPGFDPGQILDYLNDANLSPVAIANTHGHADHIAGNAAMKQAFPHIPIIIGHGDAPMLTDDNLNLSGPFGMPITSPPADRTLRDGDKLELAGMEFDVFEIPGHSPGHIVLVWRGEPPVVFGGDVLFRGSIGRTDFPGGSYERLKGDIHAKLWPLPDDTIVYPGHGPATTIGHEKRTNQFL